MPYRVSQRASEHLAGHRCKCFTSTCDSQLHPTPYDISQSCSPLPSNVGYRDLPHALPRRLNEKNSDARKQATIRSNRVLIRRMGFDNQWPVARTAGTDQEVFDVEPQTPSSNTFSTLTQAISSPPPPPQQFLAAPINVGSGYRLRKSSVRLPPAGGIPLQQFAGRVPSFTSQCKPRHISSSLYAREEPLRAFPSMQG